MLPRARPLLLSALRGVAALSPIGWAEIHLGQAVPSSGKEQMVVRSRPSPDLHPTLDPGDARKPLCSSKEVFTFSGLCSSCALLPNIFEHLIFCVVPLWRFPGAPREALFHRYLVGMESSTPPLINSPQMSQSRGCFALPCVPSASLSHHLPGSPNCGCI